LMVIDLPLYQRKIQKSVKINNTQNLFHSSGHFHLPHYFISLMWNM